VPCGEETLHLSYCHNPFRYVWNERDSTLANRDPLTRSALRTLFDRWRHWDRAAAQRVDSYVTNSEITRQRIERYYGRDARVIPPPVDTRRFRPGPVGEHYLVLSALMAHKRIDVTIEAFNKLGRPLVIVGDGPDMKRLQQLAGPNVTFVGRVSDARAAELLQSCRALVVAAIEEFGIAAVEAQAAGRPVIAAQAGGTLETVREGETGCFWNGGPDELVAAVRGFDDDAVDPLDCVENAERFGLEAFQRALAAEAERTWRRFKSNGRRSSSPPETLRRRSLRRTTVTVPPEPWRANGANGRTRRFERDADSAQKLEV
jgi:glycosyltransferase involved in cell wall biosynthesis